MEPSDQDVITTTLPYISGCRVMRAVPGVEIVKLPFFTFAAGFRFVSGFLLSFFFIFLLPRPAGSLSERVSGI